MQPRKLAWVPVDLAEERHGSARRVLTSLESVWEDTPFPLEKRMTCYTRDSQFRGLVSMGVVRTSSWLTRGELTMVP